ncbi:PepSY domain-containing protein [Asaia astilbis]
MRILHKKAVRFTFLLHRWLGITLGLMMSVWCLSGIVMLWKAWPQPDETHVRMAHETISLRGTLQLPQLTGRYRNFRLLMVHGVPLLQARSEQGDVQSFNLRNGIPFHFSPDDLLGDVKRYASLAGEDGIPHFQGLRQDDQWILNTPEHRSGLYRYEIEGPSRRLLYLSPSSGDIMQETTQETRFWAWIGAIPHWLYPSLLKRHQTLWVDTLTVLSGLGIFLTALGLWIGWRRFRTGRHLSPYQRLHRVHHLGGLIFGVVLLSWITTGFLTMNPAGLMARGETPQWVTRMTEPVEMSALAPLILALQAHSEHGYRTIDIGMQNHEIVLNAVDDAGAFERLNEHLGPAPLTEGNLTRSFRERGLHVQIERLTVEDAYYFSSHFKKRSLPVFRIIGPEAMRLYLDGHTGAALLLIDPAARASRWMIYGPHDLDFFSWLRRPLARLLFVLPLLLGATTLCLAGFMIGMKRVAQTLKNASRESIRREQRSTKQIGR